MKPLREVVKRELRELNQKVVRLYEQGSYDEAIELAIHGCEVALRDLGETHPYHATALSNLGVLYHSIGNHAAAERLGRQALDIRRTILGVEHPDYTTSLNNLAGVYRSLGNYTAAESLLREAIEIDAKVLGEAHPGYATDLNSLGLLYTLMGKYDAAEPLFCRVLEIRRRAQGEEHPEFVTGLNNLAALYDSMGRYDAAEPLYRRALEITRRVLGEEHPDFGTCLNNLAAYYCQTGDYRAAEPLLHQALEISRRTVGEAHRDFASTLNNLAHVYLSMGNYPAAERCYRRAIEVSRGALGETHSETATSLNNLAELYYEMGDFREAESLYREALQVISQALGEDHPHFARCLNNLALLYRTTGNYAAAESHYEQALAVCRKVLGYQHPDVATTMSNLAMLYRATGDVFAAMRLDLEALEIRRRAVGEEHPDFAASLNSAAILCETFGNYEMAEQFHRQALEILRRTRGDGHPYVAVGLNNLAMLFCTIGNHGAAEPLFLEALETQRHVLGWDHPDVSLTLLNLAGLYVATDRERDALELVLEAGSIVTQMIGHVFSMGSETQRMAFAESVVGSFYLLLSLVAGHLSLSAVAIRAALDLAMRRKAVGAEGLAIQRDTVLGGRYPALAGELRELTELRMLIARSILAGPGVEGAEAHRGLLDEWTAAREQLEAALARKIPEMNIEQMLHTADSRKVALALPPESAVLEFVRFNVFDFKAIPARGESQLKAPRYLAFVLRAGESDGVSMIDLGEAAAIDSKIAAFRESITGEIVGLDSQGEHTRAISEIDMNAGLELRAAIFDPLLGALGGYRRILIAPDGNLSRLPFEVLPAGPERYLIDDYRISYIGTGRDVLRFGTAPRRPSGPAVVVADPDFDLEDLYASSGCLPQEGVPAAMATGRKSRDFDPSKLYFERLPGTRAEGNRVAEMLGVQAWLGSAALETRVKSCRSPCILHLATHGFFLPDQTWDLAKPRQMKTIGGGTPDSMSRPGLENPMLRSGLALAGANIWCRGGSLPPEAEDGILTAEEVAGLDLLDTELVVLSACETGLGHVRVGEGVFGLRRAFVAAGTKGLVMSLWKVPDDETRELMEEFYGRILNKPQLRADALRGAQLAIKEKYPDPVYWGAFIYEGDPNPPEVAGD